MMEATNGKREPPRAANEVQAAGGGAQTPGESSGALEEQKENQGATSRNRDDLGVANENRVAPEPTSEDRANPKPSSQTPVTWTSPDGAFTKLVLEAGHGLARPTLGCRCQVLLQAPPGTSLSYPTGHWVEIQLGQGPTAWDDLVDACLQSMAPGERVQLQAQAGGTMEVSLCSFLPAPELWELPPDTQWALALGHKALGTERYRQGDVGAAARCYTRALRLAVAAGPQAWSPGTKAELHANLAACQLRLGQPAHAARNSAKALALSPSHTKARYRQALAAAALGDLEAAAEDLRALLEADPGNTAARRELGRVVQQARERDAHLAKAMSKLFR